MKKVLLFADIGGHANQEYYHVGDEAMFLATYDWYKQHRATWQMTILSWFPTHSHLTVKEKLHLQWSANSRSYFPLLLYKFFWWRLTKHSLFSDAEFTLVKTIQEQDSIHFTGGGNLSSQFRHWLYYAFFIIIVAKVLRKEIILTSQTIGPISGVDRLFAFWVLNLPNHIALRNMQNVREIRRYGIFLPKIRSMLDAAYVPAVSTSVSKNPVKQIQIEQNRKKNTYTIGLSIHAWKNYEQETLAIISEALTLVSQAYQLRVVLIPHHLGIAGADFDSVYMKQLIAELPPRITVLSDDFPKVPASELEPASYVKQLTAEVDLLITTRYHGLVFALSQNVPTIALHFDTYCERKNTGILKRVYGDETTRHEILSTEETAAAKLADKMQFILDNQLQEKKRLKDRNRNIARGNDTLDAVLQQLRAKT